MKNRKSRYFACDFETTVYEGQVNTEVWAAACVELFSENTHIFHSIKEQFDYFISLNSHIIAYYHNLKFDGSFWLSYLMVDLGLKQAETHNDNDINSLRFDSISDMPNNSFNYNISSMGEWYRIVIKIRNKVIEIRDSLKLLPFSIKKIGESFGTKHKKLEMEYEGLRYAGCVISDEEKEYIINDIMVLKEALEIMFTEGNKKLTIGACCLSQFKQSIGGKTYDKYFPNLYQHHIDKDLYGVDNAGDYIRQSYHGGWCYLVKGKEKKIYTAGTTADVNSLYPSMMSSESGNYYPRGFPTFWHGDYIPDIALTDEKFFFIRFVTKFYIKPGKLPFIQLKNTFMYPLTEMLETSDIYNREDGNFYDEYYDFEGNLVPATVTMTMTQTDYLLFREHYDVKDFKILDGCYFDVTTGIFDPYINKYKQIKMTSKGAQRELAKLFLNNLYGKMASSPNSNFKVAYLKDDKTIGFYTVIANDKIPGYIPVGSAITSYARNFTIRAAQKNYHGPDKPGFIYADTDSIHCDLLPEDLTGIRISPNDFCAWKLESCWDIAYFVRQKTYIEHVTHEDLQEVDRPYYAVKCAGMPEKCKKLFLRSMSGEKPKDTENLTNEEREFLTVQRSLTDFDIGLKVPGKLLPKRIRGGVLLTPTTYEMR